MAKLLQSAQFYLTWLFSQTKTKNLQNDKAFYFHKGSNNSAKPEQLMIPMSTNSHNWIRFIWLLKIQNVWRVWVQGFPNKSNNIDIFAKHKYS